MGHFSQNRTLSATTSACLIAFERRTRFGPRLTSRGVGSAPLASYVDFFKLEIAGELLDEFGSRIKTCDHQISLPLS